MSFDGSGPKVIPDLEQTFLADSGYTAPAVGDPVYISGDDGKNSKVSLCTGASPAFVGFVQSVIPADTFGNKLLNVYVFGHRIRCKNTSGVTLTAGQVVTSGNGGITALSAVTDATIGGDLTANTTTGAITSSGLAAIINAQMNRRGVVAVGGANNAMVQIIFG
jgi:hypothetical protein